MPPPNMTLWHEDNFELKAFEKLQVQEKTQTFPFLPESKTYNSHVKVTITKMGRYGYMSIHFWVKNI